MLQQITKLYTRDAVRNLDNIAINELGISGFSLMQKAGNVAFKILCKLWPKAKNIVILCGKGNNAGDGYVFAELAQQHNLDVTILFLGDPEKLAGDAQKAYQAVDHDKVEIRAYTEDDLTKFDLIVDALLGTGLKGQVREDYCQVINTINSANKPVLAIDIPSGLDADTGNLLGACVRADATVTFVGAKQGFFTGIAPDYCGQIFYDDLDVPAEVFAKTSSNKDLITPIELPQRKKVSHKGDYGHVVVVGGDFGMPGAVRMAGEAALRTGAGWVTVITRPEHITTVTATRPELMCYGIAEPQTAKDILAKATVLVLGPGLGQSEWSRELFNMAIDLDVPKVIDADALNLLVEFPRKQNNWILTPHPGEAARLLGCRGKSPCLPKDIQADRFAAITELQQQYGGVIVLKGAGTLVLGDDGNIGVCNKGNPGMASAGMGDVLSGIIGGLLAQFLNPPIPLSIKGGNDFFENVGASLAGALEFAAKQGVIMHAMAADEAVKMTGERGLLATDLTLTH